MQEQKEINKKIYTSKIVEFGGVSFFKKFFYFLQPFGRLKGIMYVKQKNTLKKERKN